MDKPKIAILDDYYARAHTYAHWDKADFGKFVFFDKAFNSADEAVNALREFQAIGLMRERTAFPSSLIKQLPSLELIVTSGKKNAAIDVTAAQNQGITVCGTESPGFATAELAFLLLMTLSRQLVPLVNGLQLEGNWQPVIGRDLRGQTLGILGLGRLGSQLAGFAQAMGMKVIAWSENLSEADCQEKNVRYVSRVELFEEADLVSIHLRHSSRTHHMVCAEDLKRLGANGYLVNTSRAEIVDPDALKSALDLSLFAGMATDVFYKEPADLSDWMVQHPKILTTPHIGYCTEETFGIFYQQTLDAMEAYYNGSPIRLITSA